MTLAASMLRRHQMKIYLGADTARKRPRYLLRSPVLWSEAYMLAVFILRISNPGSNETSSPWQSMLPRVMDCLAFGTELLHRVNTNHLNDSFSNLGREWYLAGWGSRDHLKLMMQQLSASALEGHSVTTFHQSKGAISFRIAGRTVRHPKSKGN